jgi:RNA polymerase sigma factor (sigma-70 family)
MPTSMIEQIRRMACGGAALLDGELLGRFVDRCDEAALAALVNRHGPMVWGVCRRLLGHHDAEDAFQATFIVLVKKASSIAHRELVGNWLYGVAHQTALQARRATSRRKEVQVMEMPDAEAPQDQWDGLRPILDEELSRLPDHYRAAIVLSDLEGKTRKEVAAQLGCPEGTVASRLVRARAMLARRLTKRGVALSAGTLAAALSRNASAVPPSVVMSTIRAASLCAAGQAATPVKVAALAEGVLKTMLMSKLKTAVAVVLVLGLMAIGATVLTSRTASARGDIPPPAEERVKGKLKLEEKADTAIAWGKEVDGLQMGLALLPQDTHTVRQGEKVKFAVKLRNVGKAEATVTYGRLRDYAPEITTDTGGRVSVYTPPPSYAFYGYALPPIKRALKPGETITLYNPDVAVEPEDRRAKVLGDMWVATPTICVAPGKYKIAFGGMIQSHPKLSTGTVEFEVKDVAKPVEPVTEWGKESGGLQAGLGFKAGEKRPYHHGEEAWIVLRLRNIGKAPVEFSHIGAFFVENPPTITDADGKILQLPKLAAEGKQAPHDTPIAPGKEVVLYEWNCGLQPIGGISKNLFTIHGTGKFTLQCTRIVGPTTGNPNHPNPTLDKLATGKLELEIKSAPPAEKK